MKPFFKHMIAVYIAIAMVFVSGTTNTAFVQAAETSTVTTYTLKTSEIHIRDPYILPYEGKYYLYGTDGASAFSGNMDSFHVYVSEDLENWTKPYEIYRKTSDFWADHEYWAPEVYVIDGTFYMYASMGGSSRTNKGIQLFKSDSPLGPFVPASEYPFTPESDDDIDATLYVEDGIYYMVYSQGTDGIYAVELNSTYDGFKTEQFQLFDVKNNGWAVTGFLGQILNDGPCFYKTKSGRLLCLYSTMADTGYNMGIAASDNGKLNGNWSFISEKLLSEGDGGHCMIFTDFDGNTRICYHTPNGDSVPVVYYLVEDTVNDTISISKTPAASNGGNSTSAEEENPVNEQKNTVSAPAKVKNIKVSVTENSVKLSWSRSSDADGYLIFRKDSKTKKYVNIKTVSADTTSYTDSKKKSATAYTYKVCAYKTSTSGNVNGKMSSMIKALTRPKSTKITSLKRKGKILSSSKAEISFKAVSGGSRYIIYKYNTSSKKFTEAFKVQDKKLYKYNSSKKKYDSIGKASLKNGTYSATLTGLNLKKEKTQKYRIQVVSTKKGYTNSTSAVSKTVTLK